MMWQGQCEMTIVVAVLIQHSVYKFKFNTNVTKGFIWFNIYCLVFELKQQVNFLFTTLRNHVSLMMCYDVAYENNVWHKNALMITISGWPKRTQVFLNFANRIYNNLHKIKENIYHIQFKIVATTYFFCN